MPPIHSASTGHVQSDKTYRLARDRPPSLPLQDGDNPLKSPDSILFAHLAGADHDPQC